MLIHRGALLAGAVAIALAGGCKYDLDKLKGAEVADAAGTGGVGGGAGGGRGGALIPPEEDAASDVASVDADAAPVTMMPASSPPDMIPDRMSPPPMIPPETIGGPALVAYWPMEEGMGGYVYDATPNANDGTFLFDPVWQAGGFPASTGRSAWKIRFDGNDDYVEVLPKTLPDIDKPKSICFWIRIDYEVDANRLEAMVAFINRPASAGVRIEFREAKLMVTSYFFKPIVTLPPPPLGWHHIAYTYDGNVHTLYLNGGANIDVGGMEMPGVATSMVPAEIGAANTKDGRFRMGRSSSGVPDAFRGFLDDVRVYNKALSAAEVKSLSLGSK